LRTAQREIKPIENMINVLTKLEVKYELIDNGINIPQYKNGKWFIIDTDNNVIGVIYENGEQLCIGDERANYDELITVMNHIMMNEPRL